MSFWKKITGTEWIGKRSVRSHTVTLTERDLQLHVVENFKDSGISTEQKAKEVLDCIENYFINARRNNWNAVWAGWFTQCCFRRPDGYEVTKIYWHKPFRLMMRKINSMGKQQ